MTRSVAAVLVATGVVVAAANGSGAASPGLREQLVGCWRLVSYETRTRSGEVEAVYGPSPRGLLIYDSGGRMSVHLMDSRRKGFASGDRLKATPEELKQAFDGYFGYFGTYSVDEAARAVIHHVEGAAFPNYVGTEQKRFFTLSGDRLELSTPPTVRGGVEVTFLVRWERERP